MTQSIRRVILRHTAGPTPGLHQILGTIDTALGLPPKALPEVSLSPDGRLAGARLDRVTDRAVWYAETPASPVAGILAPLEGIL